MTKFILINKTINFVTFKEKIKNNVLDGAVHNIHVRGCRIKNCPEDGSLVSDFKTHICGYKIGNNIVLLDNHFTSKQWEKANS